jgi:hypothetical protein
VLVFVRDRAPEESGSEQGDRGRIHRAQSIQDNEEGRTSRLDDPLVLIMTHDFVIYALFLDF